ncbi:MAG TPA: hypothetical protein VEL74_19475 [Thermoanaerobaculia bacterium]|nr:hypothetical protein [Thermoanaerobaculia bacterium]
MSQEAFEALLRELDPDDRDRAAELYLQLRRKLIRVFEWRGCSSPEELVDETLDRVGQRLAEDVKPNNPASYAQGVARHIYQEAVRREAMEQKRLKSGDWPPHSPEDPEPDDRRLEALRDCLEKLGQDQRRLVLVYHQSDSHIEHRKKLSNELGIPINALRIRVHRLRRRLAECIEARLGN